MKSYNTYYTSFEALKVFLDEKSIFDSQSLLIQVFTSKNDEIFISKLTIQLNSLLPQSYLIGSTTDGEIKDGLVTTNQTVICFSIFEKTSLKIYIQDNVTDFFDAGKKMANDLINENTKLIISFIDGLHGNGEEFLNAIHDVNNHVKVAGGMSGDNATFEKTFVFTKDTISKSGVVGVSFSSDSLHVYSDYSFHWLPIGKTLKITKAVANRVYTIDNRTAYETYAYYLGENIAKKLPSVGIEFPLIIKRNDVNIARAVLGKEDGGSLVFAGNLKTGDDVRFGYGDSNSILSYAQENVQNLTNHPVESIFIYSCMARRRFMPESIETETKPFNSMATTTGFFTYGEFYSSTKNELLNQTMTILTLSESDVINKNAKIEIENNQSNNDTIKALSHLINVSSTELEIEKDKAQESTKSKSEFLANMSHEIRTPMNAIIGMSYLALETELTKQQQSYLNKIDSSAKSLLGIINDILDFSKIEAGKLTIEKVEFDLHTTIENIVNLIEFKLHEKKIELNVNYDSAIGSNLYGDNLRITQILLNLMGNAVKFTQAGEIGVYIKKESFNKFRFEVRDTGIGLSDEQQEKLFKSFSQADGSTTREYGGTGLGLVISKQLVELMNGKIWVESEEGKGSSFIFEIELEEQITKKDYTIFRNKSVLIVDDNHNCNDILRNLLEMFGLKVDCAFSGKEALLMIQNNNFKYDIVFMDWSMPDMDGIETSKNMNILCKKYFDNGEISSNKPTTVVMVSAFRQESIIKSANDIGIDIFLQKPLNPTLLNDILSAILLEGKDISYNYTKKENSLKNEMKTLEGSKILIVEDSATNQEILLGILEPYNINIDIACNGLEAVDMVQKNSYEVVLMDIQMPVMDGYEATSIIRKTNENIPIIALTANAMREDIEKTKNIGMNEHLNKPIDIEQLYQTLLKYISKKIDL